MINQIILRKLLPFFAIIIFTIIFGLINLCKPSFIYKKDLTFREFGLGTKNKTIVPIWLVSIIIAICSYVLVLWFYSFKNIEI